MLYDGECGFCRWGVRRLLRLDRGHTLRAVAIQSAEGSEALESLASEARLASWHVRSPDGRLSSAGGAVPVLLRLLPGGRAPAFVAERFPRTVERLYGLVARNRGRLGRLVGANRTDERDRGAGGSGPTTP